MAIEKEFHKGDALLKSVKKGDSKVLEKLYDDQKSKQEECISFVH